jgi:hypothetical protein
MNKMYIKRKYFLIIVVGFLTMLPKNVFAQPSKRNLDIYLLIGQSNMGGRNTIGDADKDIIPGVWLLKGKDDWVKGQNPMNVYSSIQGGAINRVNCGYTFSKKMRSLIPDKEIGIVSNAKGRTGIQEWLPGTTYYNEAVKRAKLAMEYGTIKGILWHQGEQDAKDPANVAKYLERVKTLINGLRKDLGNATLPFVAGEISQESPNYVGFNKMIQGFPGILINTALVDSDGLKTSDKVHFDTPSMKKLGERYADKYFALIKGAAKCSIVANVNINNGGWKLGDNANVNVGDEVWFGPQSKEFGPSTTGWTWKGPLGFTANTREIKLVNIKSNQAGTYVVTNTDKNGCKSTYNFNVTINTPISKDAITVTGAGFETRNFANGSAIFTNRAYTLENIPAIFKDYQFCASNGGEVNTGSIIPESNGFVYVIAPTSANISGWKLVANSNFNATDKAKTSMSIFQKAGVANVAIAIPDAGSFTGATPLAKKINLKKVAASRIGEIENKIKVQPNPVVDPTFTVSTQGIVGSEIMITDLSGKVVFDKILGEDSSSEHKIRKPSEKGVYIVIVKDVEGYMHSSKLIVQ